jgi:DNA polymerase theta
MLLYSVRYHHAQLREEQKELIEKGYGEGVIAVLVATTTLAAGVDLPAQRVIFRTPVMGGAWKYISTDR